jgi:hypothetical protein
MKLLLPLTPLAVALAMPAMLRDSSLSSRVKVGPLDPDRILCPILAALLDKGALHPDSEGDVTLEDIYNGLYVRPMLVNLVVIRPI